MVSDRKSGQSDGDSAEVERVNVVTGEIVETGEPQSALDLLHKIVAERAAEGVDPETEAMDRIIGSILTADSLEDVLGEKGPLKAAEVVGIPLTVHGVSFTESDVPDARIPFYATFHGVRQDTGQSVVVNCGGEQVLAQALKLDAMGEWPIVVTFVQVGKEKPGRTRPYRLTWTKPPESGAPDAQPF